MRFLVERGVSMALRSAGLRGIVATWDAIASGAERYDLTLDDWLNDLDLRDILAGAMSVAPERERAAVRLVVELADTRFRQATAESPLPLVANVDGVVRWWYFRYPMRPGTRMRADLIAAGLSVGA